MDAYSQLISGAAGWIVFWGINVRIGGAVSRLVAAPKEPSASVLRGWSRYAAAIPAGAEVESRAACGNREAEPEPELFSSLPTAGWRDIASSPPDSGGVYTLFLCFQ